MLVTFGALAPFAAMPLPQVAGFIPANEGMIFIVAFVTSVFLFSQFSETGSHALLVLASGYLFSALIVIPHTLTFPGSFSPVEFVGAGSQASAWLYVSWKFGFFVAVACYAWLKDGKRAEVVIRNSPLSPVFWSATIVTGFVCALTWFAVMYDDFLPRLLLNEVKYSSLAHYVGGFDFLIGALTLFLLWTRRESVLDHWLMVAVFALTAELALVSFFAEGRFNLGFYSGHVFAVISSTVVLVTLLAEATGLYARLVQMFRTVQHERDSKLLSLQAFADTIAHEVNQPITAIVLEGNTAQTYLDRAPPNLEEVRASLNAIADNAVRGTETLKSIRALLRIDNHEMRDVDVNEIITEALSVMRVELKVHQIETHTDLASNLSFISGHKGQLLEVVLNLLRNAVEVLGSVTDRNRVIRVRTERYGSDKIAITVEDSGPGIDPKIIDKIFDTFMTTKRSGMGLGLSLCRMIIERHGGHVLALPSTGVGARFQIILPVNVS